VHSENVGSKTAVKAAYAVRVSLRCRVELEVFNGLIINKEEFPYKKILVHYLLLPSWVIYKQLVDRQ